MTDTNDHYRTIGNSGNGEPAVELKPGMVINSKYELIEQIGRGGMGVVWKGKDRVGNRLVALKFVPRDLQRFVSEIQRVREMFGKVHVLNHQSICPLYGLEDGGTQIGYYLVMKYLEGETLSEYITRVDRKRKGFPLSQVVSVLLRVARALDHAHRHDVIHRDIKPSNIFLVTSDKGTEVQLIDFGLADEIKPELANGNHHVSGLSGTLLYMAPEQWRKHRQTAMTDQYALAVVAYKLLSGRLPFDATDAKSLRQSVLRETPLRIKNIPDFVNDAIQKALSKNQERRFESCVAFIKALAEESTAVPEEPEAQIVDFFELPEIASVLSQSSVVVPKVQVPPVEAHPKPSVIPVVPHPPLPETPSVTSLTKRGYLFLEDSDWQQANEYFDRVLDIEPEYAPAYIGKLCVELKVRGKEQLGDHKQPISEYGNFKKAVRFADAEYRTTVKGYDEKIRERLRQEQEQREVEKRIDRERQEESRRLVFYEQLREEEKKASTETDFQSLAQQFRAMNGYKDTVELAEESYTRYIILKNQREENERIEEERLETEKRERQRIAEKVIAKMKIGIAGYETSFDNIFDAAEKGTVYDVAYFIKNGVDCNVKSAKGRTPLHFAAGNTEKDHILRMKFLIEIGANVNVKDNNGETPLDCIRRNDGLEWGCVIFGFFFCIGFPFTFIVIYTVIYRIFEIMYRAYGISGIIDSDSLLGVIVILLSCLIELIIFGLFPYALFVDGRKKRKKKDILRAAGGKSEK